MLLHIRAGTLVIPAIWNMQHDSENFPHADRFDPFRFYDPNDECCVRKDASLIDDFWTFGFGRRACPARYLAVNSMWIAVASLLWAFKFEPSRDHKTGALVNYNLGDLKWQTGVNIEPCMIPLEVSSRSPVHSRKIREEWAEITTQQ